MTKHRKLLRWSAAGLVAMWVCGASLAATESTPEDKASLENHLKLKGYTLGKEVDSVANYRIDGFQYVDPRHVLFTANGKSAYLLKLRVRCPELAGYDGISYASVNSRLTKFDFVRALQPTGIANRTCPIESINELGRITPPVKAG